MIYLLEDDVSIRELVVYTLRHTGFEARGFGSAAAFWEALHERTPALVLLDIMLPDEDGLSVLRRLRAAPATELLPVIMLTARGTEYDKVLGLDTGADDYIPKPFGMMELVARIRGLLRRSAAQDNPATYRMGSLSVSIPRHRVTVDGEAVSLTLKEFELLAYLLQNTGLVLSRDQILSAVWGYDFDSETRTVDVHIRTLRLKLGAAGNLIRTVRGVGYTMGGDT